MKDVAEELLGVVSEVAAGLGEVLGAHKRNQVSQDQRFCIDLTSGGGWQTQVSVTNATTGDKAVITLDYCNLPIRCRFCLAIDHLVKDYPGLASRTKENDTSHVKRDVQMQQDEGQIARGGDSQGTVLPDPPPLQPVQALPDQINAAPLVHNVGSSGSIHSNQPRPNNANHLMVQGVSSDPNNPSVRGGISATSEGTERSRLTPEYEWNGWEKVMRRPKGQPQVQEGKSQERSTARIFNARARDSTDLSSRPHQSALNSRRIGSGKSQSRPQQGRVKLADVGKGGHGCKKAPRHPIAAPVGQYEAGKGIDPHPVDQQALSTVGGNGLSGGVVVTGVQEEHGE